MTLVLILVTLIIIGFFLATVVYRNSWWDWPLNVGVHLMLYGSLLLVTVLLLGFAGKFWDFVFSQINQLRAF